MLGCTRWIILICFLAALHYQLDNVGEPQGSVKSFGEVTKALFPNALHHENSLSMIV